MLKQLVDSNLIGIEDATKHMGVMVEEFEKMIKEDELNVDNIK